MKKELSPAVIAIVAVVVLIVFGYFGYRAMAPKPYSPSPGWDRGRPGNASGAPSPNSGMGSPTPMGGVTSGPPQGMQPGQGNSPTSGPFGPPNRR